MSGKIVNAVYDAEHNTLRLAEPLEGVNNDDTVSVVVTKTVDPQRPWMRLSGIMSKERGEAFARALAELEND